MRKKQTTTIDLFVASGCETKPIRNKIELELKKLSTIYEKSGFDFNLLWWEDHSDAYPSSGRSQDEYNKMIDESDMVAVIIENTLGKYTVEEFNYAVDLFKTNKHSPRVVVYTLPTNADNDSRYKFIKSLRSGKNDYFHCEIKEGVYQLIDKIKGELLRIKNDYEDEERKKIESAVETINRLSLDDDLTKEALRLFKEGDYTAASDALDIEEINKCAEELSKRVEELSNEQTKVAEAFVLKAKLELTDVKNKERFIIAESLFEKALNSSRAPKILFEYAYYYQNQNIFKKAKELYTEALEIYRELAADNPSTYNPYVAMTLNNLANLHSDNNQYKLAEEEYTEALEIYRELADDNPSAYNPDVAMTLNNLANLHYNNNQYKLAEEGYTEALELYRELAADSPSVFNPDVAMTLNNLAILHCNNNQYKLAEEEFNEALELITPFYNSNPKVYKKLYDDINEDLKQLGD